VNCNTLFSVLVAHDLTEAEREWLRVKQAARENYWAGEAEDEADAEYWINLEGVWFEATETGDFLLISEEDGAPEAAADFIQEFLAEFRPAEAVIFEWAHTATKMRPGEFGGGAAVITAQEMRWLDPLAWIQDQLHAIRRNSQRKLKRGRTA